MGRKKKSNKKRNYNYKKKNKNEDGKEDFWTGIFIVVVFILLWIGFWLGVVLAIFLLLKFTHKLNIFLKLYNTNYYYGAIATFLISALIILFGGTQIAYNMGKINNTFWGWAVESSDYLKINNSKGRTTIKPNVEGMIKKGAIDKLPSTGNNLK